MGKTVQANAVITLNMEPARQKVEEFEGLIGKAKKELEELNKKPINLQTDKEKKRIKELTDKEIPKLEQQLKKAKDSLKGFRDTLQHLDKASINDLTNAKRALNDQIRRLTPGTKEYIAATSDFKKVNDRLASLNAAYRQVNTSQGGFIGGIKGVFGWFNKYWGGLTMLSGALTGLSATFRKCAEDAAKLDDVYADVMKTTGLMHDEVAELDKELMQINTRTSREQLLLLARDAGKLGIQGKDNILGFVRAADQIQVALGEDLGEGAIKNLGKIADVLGYTKSMGTEQALLSIGSAINAVGQDSTASEAYLVEFTQRLAGVGAQAGLSAADLIGFASGLDQSAMKVEMASTAFQKFLMKMYEDPAQFAAYAKMEVQEFTELLKNDANTAITTVLKSLKDQDGFAAMVPIFKDMGLDGARAVSVLASMASNLDAVTGAQALANVEFAEATSITEEYNTKNNNLQAQLEKARKKFHNASIALGQSLNPIMLKSTKGITYLIKALATYGKEIKAAVISIAALTVAVKLQAIAHAGYNAVVKIGTALQATWKTITWAVRVAFYKLIGATEAATIAQAELNAVMSASVFGVIALAVAGLTAAIVHYAKKQKEANEVAKKMQEIQDRINTEYSEGAGKVEALTNIVHNNNIALDERRKALEELKKIVPEYHADLTREGQLINDNTEALSRYLENLERVTRSKILQDEYEQATAAVMKAEKEKAEAEARKMQALIDANGDDTTIKTFTMQSTAGASNWSEVTPYGEAVKDLEEKTDALTTAQKTQAEIMAWITKEYGVMGQKAGEGMSEMEKAIIGVNSKYEEQLEMLEYSFSGDEKAREKERKRLEEERDQELAAIRKRYAAATQTALEGQGEMNAILSEAQFQLLEDRYAQLTKKEQAMVDKGYAALSSEESTALKKRYDRIMAADQNLLGKRYQQELKAIQQQQRAEQNELNRQYFNQEITAQEHEKRLRKIKMDSLQAQLALALQYGQDTTQIEASIITEQSNARKADYQEELKEVKAYYAEEEHALKLSLASGEITQKRYDALMLSLKMNSINERLGLAKEYGQDETAIMNEWLAAEVEAQKLANAEMAELKKEAKKALDGLRSPSDARDAEMQEQMVRLATLHEAMLLSEEQYEEALRQLRKKYADEDLKEKLANVQKYAEKSNSILQGASNFVNALKDAETAKLEAEYQAQLTAAGDNAEQREKIEAEYEEKKLDLQKKYADIDMAINIAKTIANGAGAAIKAWMELGPIGGPIMAGVIAATTAAEVATIIQQRNAIKNSSVNSSSGNSGSAYVRSMTGYKDGGFTEKDPSDNKEVGVIHANEWVAPAWMVRKNRAEFASLERYRRSRGLLMDNQDRFFNRGGFTGGERRSTRAPKQANPIDVDWQAIRDFNDMMRYCSENGLFVKYGDIEEARKKETRFKRQTTRS